MASGDLEQPVSVTEGGEIGVLGESLETMRAQLKGSLETVRRWGGELELKVGERTAELNARNRQLAAVSAIMAAANETHELEGDARPLPRRRARADRNGRRGRCGWSTVERRSVGDASRGASGTTFPCTGCGEWFCLDAIAGGTGAHEPRRGGVVPPRCRPRPRGSRSCPCTARTASSAFSRSAAGDGRVPAEDGQPVLAAICDQIAVAIENARLAGELGRLEARHEVQRMRSELISAVSHELRTPLGFIKGYATTLLREDTPIEPGTRRQFLEIIDEETVKLEHMIEELLDASRLQAGRLPIERGRASWHARRACDREGSPGSRGGGARGRRAAPARGDPIISIRSGSSRYSTTCSRTPRATRTRARRSRWPPSRTSGPRRRDEQRRGRSRG